MCYKNVYGSQNFIEVDERIRLWGRLENMRQIYPYIYGFGAVWISGAEVILKCNDSRVSNSFYINGINPPDSAEPDYTSIIDAVQVLYQIFAYVKNTNLPPIDVITTIANLFSSQNRSSGFGSNTVDRMISFTSDTDNINLPNSWVYQDADEYTYPDSSKGSGASFKFHYIISVNANVYRSIGVTAEGRIRYSVLDRDGGYIFYDWSNYAIINHSIN